MSKAITDVLYATATFGSYQAWTRGGAGLAQSRIVSASYHGPSGAGADSGQGRWDWVGALSVCTGGCFRNPDIDPELVAWARFAMEMLARFGNLKVIPSLVPPGGDVTINGQVSVEPGRSVSAAAAAGPVRVATINQRFAANRPTTPAPVYTAKGRSILAGLDHAATFLARVRVTPSRGQPTTQSWTFKLVPAPPDQ